MSSRILLAALFSAVGLSACGGGSSDQTENAAAPAPAQAQAPAPAPVAAPAPAPAPAPVAPVNTAKLFVPASRPHLAVFSSTRQSVGQLTSHHQVPQLAVDAFNEFTLGGEYTVRGPKGDATYAMGVWTQGTVSANGSVVETLDVPGPRSWHYQLFNKATSLPTSGTQACAAEDTTSPTYVSGGAAGAPATILIDRISGTVTFSNAGADIGLNVNLSSPTGVGTSAFRVQISPTVNTAFSSGTNGGNAYITVADAGGSGYAIVGGYQVSVAGGARYTGAFRLKCV